MAWSLWEYNNAFTKLYDQCDQKLRNAIDRRAAQLMEHGNEATYPVSKPLGGRLFQLRADRQRKRARFLYFFQPDNKIIIVLGAFKDQRTLPKATIAKARVIREALVSNPELMNDLTKIH